MNEEMKQVPSEKIDMKALKKIVITRFSMLFPVLGLCFFLPAWSLKYWEGWAYIFTVAIPMAFFGVYLFKHDPKLLERRMRTKEKQKDQKIVIILSLLSFPFVFLLPGFDKRLGWSEVPLTVEIIAFAMVLLGYLMTIYVLKANSYASRIIEVEKSQKVITTGPYALVRHPMYSAVSVLYLFTPVALGSYWAIIPAVILLFVFIPRIQGEERELLANLEGYREYTQKVKYRLIPGIW